VKTQLEGYFVGVKVKFFIPMFQTARLVCGDNTKCLSNSPPF